MRQIGRLTDSEHAQRFGDYLTVQGIQSLVEADDSAWLIWVQDEEDVDRARTAFQEFQNDPNNERYRNVTREAQSLRKRAQAEVRAANDRTIHVSRQWDRRPTVPVTSLFVWLSIAVAIVGTDMSQGVWELCNKSEPILRHLYIKDVEQAGGFLRWTRGPALPEVASGQIWRLITPIFIHGSVLHILFNMMWLRQFGLVLEPRMGSKRFILMLITIAVISNFGQFVANFAIGGIPNADVTLGPFEFRLWGPAFGGMSGVNFGLFGYIWYKSRYDPTTNLFINPSASFILFGWFVLCIFGVIPFVANTAHAAGLLVGIGIAAIPLLLRRSQ